MKKRLVFLILLLLLNISVVGAIETKPKNVPFVIKEVSGSLVIYPKEQDISFVEHSMFVKDLSGDNVWRMVSNDKYNGTIVADPEKPMFKGRSPKFSYKNYTLRGVKPGREYSLYFRMKIGNSNISTPVYVSFKMSGCEHTIGNTETVVLKEATCNQEGKLEKITYCSKCGEVIDRITENVPMKRHSFTAWEVTKEAACENGGVETRRCEFCGLKEEKETPKLGHKLVHVAEVPAGKNNGVKAHYKCEHCGKLFLDDKALKEVNEADLVINALPRKTLEKITPDLLSIINAYKTDLSLNNYYVEINVNNGAKILTDYEDDFFYEYSEETVGVQSLTFTIDGDRIINIGINYCDSIQNVKTIKQKTTTRINEIVSKAKAISDETEKINAVATEIWSNYEDDFTGRDVHTNDAYGCLVLGYADKFGAASAFQAVMKRLGYSGGYYYDKTNSSVYSKTIINGKTLYTSISNDRSRKNNSYTLIEKKETNWTYKDMPLKTAEYTPISAFRDNPYLNLYDENAVYFRDKVLANEKTFTLPNEIYVNYKVGTGSYTSNIRHEYPELTFLFRSVSTYMKDNHLVITVDYLYPEARDTMLKEYYAERDKIVSRAKLLKTDTEKVIFVNNYLCKLAKYVSEAQNAHNVYGCLIDGECVCEGYATAFHAIMKELGIKDYYCQTYNHIWNKVLIDGKLKIVDVTNNRGWPCYLLSDTHEANNKTTLNSSLYLYVFNSTMEMDSSATSKIIAGLKNKNTEIVSSGLKFDAETLDFDKEWYIKTLNDTHPIEMLQVDSIDFQMNGDNVTKVKVSYKNTGTSKVDQVVNNILAKANKKSTVAEKIAVIINTIQFDYRAVYGKTDNLLDAIEKNDTSYLAKARLAGYCFEKLGIKYKIINDRNSYPYLMTYSNGKPYYHCPQLGYSNYDSIVSYAERNDYPIYDFYDFSKEAKAY